MPKKIKTVGGNLFRIAAETLGDATQANRIATANNVTDPFLVGPQTVTIPTVDLAATGGEPFGPITQQPAAVPAPVEAPVPPTPPVIPPAVVNNPPQTKGPWFVNVLSVWQPIPPVPTLAVKRSPAGLAVVVNAPIPGGQIDAQGHVWRSWTPPDPLPSLGTKLPPSQMAVQVDAPSIGGQIDAQFQVRFAWIPPDPLPTLTGKLPVATTAVAVSVWPGGSFLTVQEMSGIAASWQQSLTYFPTLPNARQSAPLFFSRVDNPPPGIDYQPFQVRPEIAPPRQKDSHIYPQQIVSVNAPPPQSVASDMVSIGQRWHQPISMPIVRAPRVTSSGAPVGTPPSTSGQFLVIAGGRDASGAQPPPPPPPPPPPGSGIVFNPGAPTPVVGSGANGITFNLTQPTTAFLNMAMFGATDTTFGPQNFNHTCPDGQGAWDFGLLSDTTFQTLVRPMGIKFVRMHAHTVIAQTFAGFPSVSNPDWWVVDSLKQADLDACFPGADFLINLQYSQNVTSNISAVASAYAAVAQRMKNNGVYIKYWSPCNEANHFPSPNYSGTQIGTLMAAVGTALHNVDSSYRVGGGDHDNAGSSLLAGAAGTGNAQFINWHAYFENAQEASEDEILNTQGVNFGEAARQAQIDARSGRPGNYLTGNTEWNMNFAPASDNDPREQSYIGSLFQTITRIHGAWAGMAFTSMFRLSYPDHFYPALINFKDGLYSPGFALRALNAYIPAGNLVATTINRSDGFGKMSAMCVNGGANFGAVIVNRDPSLSWTGPVTLFNRVSTGNLTRFDLNGSNQNGLTNPNFAAASLNSVTIPAKGLVLFAGAA